MTTGACHKCRELVLFICETKDLLAAWYDNTADLVRSAATCDVCRSIAELNILPNKSDIFSRYPSLPPDISFPLELSVSNRNWADQVLWCGLQIEIHVPNQSMYYVERGLLGISRDGDVFGWQAQSPSPSGNAASDRISLIGQWLRECSENHPECTPPAATQGSTFLPTRLLDAAPGQPVCLVETESFPPHEQVAFAALSYCWGPSLPLMTTTKNKSSFMKELPEDDMPKTFRDAIRIIRALSIRYLWIDALCIVQDDSSDWEREAQKMVDIYHGSVLTIAVSDSRDSNGGCFPDEDTNTSSSSTAGNHASLHKSEEGNPRRLRVVSYEDGGGDKSTFIRHEQMLPWAFQRGQHLNTRGWTFQELIRSHRLVHCMKPEVHWQCRRSYRTQAGFDGHSSLVQASLLTANLSNSESLGRVWCSWVEEYTNRDFTFWSDRLIAFSGIIRHYQSTTAHTPLLGLWAESFPRDLLWCRFGDAKGSAPSWMPSWTWLSRIASVAIDFWAVDSSEVKENLTLLDCQVEWSGTPFISPLKSTSLRIKAPTAVCRLKMTEESAKYNPPYLHLEGEELDPAKPIPWAFAGQFDDENWLAAEFDDYTCVLCRSRYGTTNGDDWCNQSFVMLKPAGALTYRRVGVGQIYVGVGRVYGETSFFHESGVQELELV